MITKAIASWKRRKNYPNRLRFHIPKAVSEALNWRARETLVCTIGDHEMALRPLRKDETTARFFREQRYSLIELELKTEAKETVALSTVDGEVLIMRFFEA